MAVRGRPFEKGNRMGAGRPKGLAWRPVRERIGEESTDALLQRLLILALEQDDTTAAKILMDRLFPVFTEATKLLEIEIEALQAELAELKAKPRLVA